MIAEPDSITDPPAAAFVHVTVSPATGMNACAFRIVTSAVASDVSDFKLMLSAVDVSTMSVPAPWLFSDELQSEFRFR